MHLLVIVIMVITFPEHVDDQRVPICQIHEFLNVKDRILVRLALDIIYYQAINPSQAAIARKQFVKRTNFRQFFENLWGS